MRLLSALALVLVLSSAPALARNLYIEGRGGLVVLADSVVGKASGEEITVEFDPGWMLEGAGGVALENGIRGEVAIGFRRNAIDDIDFDGGGGGVDLEGHINTLTAMGNFYYDWDFGRTLGWTGAITKVKPYVGAGLGVARINLELSDRDGVNFDKSETEYELAYQGSIGVGFHFTEHVALSVGYQFLGTTNPTIHEDQGTFRSHNFLTGLRFSF